MQTETSSKPIDKSHFSKEALLLAFEELADRLKTSRIAAEATHRKTAAGFNVFDFIAPSENILSDILAFLLNPDASHGQGPLFLEILVARVRPGMPLPFDPVRVAREALTYSILRNRRRIDILVSLPEFVLAIETKKFSGEGPEQISDYADHLRNISGDGFCLIFLTRTGDEAACIDPIRSRELQNVGQLQFWSWEQNIPNWLDDCRRACQAPKIQHFLEDFKSYIATYLAMNPPEETYAEEE
jgi:hypothetical protein